MRISAQSLGLKLYVPSQAQFGNQVGDNDIGLEPGELPGRARDSDHSVTAHQIEYHMTVRLVVARARPVEGDVAVSTVGP